MYQNCYAWAWYMYEIDEKKSALISKMCREKINIIQMTKTRYWLKFYEWNAKILNTT